jgi:hypothetical protein
VIALVLSASAVVAQSAPVTIRGRVVDAENDRPLRRAIVSMAGSGQRVRPVLTDADGRFEIRVADRSVSLTIAKAGYATTRLGSPRDPQREFEIRLARSGVVSGRIFDSNGESAPGMKVRARPDGTASGPPQIFESETDDLGEYRIAGLPAGRYSVSPVLTGPRVLTAADYQRLEALIKEGRRPFETLLEEPSGPPRSTNVRSGEETGSIDFQIVPSQNVRALAPVRHLLPQVQHPPDGRPGLVIGGPQVELRGGRLLNTGSLGVLPRSLNIMMSGGAAVSGSVVDAAGEPLQGVVVRALIVRSENGRLVARGFGWERVTDDRGRYRLFGLVPGSYLIVASLDATEFTSGSSTAVGYAPLYFPGTTSVDGAQPVRVESGSDMSGADLTYATAVTSRLTGTVIMSDGEPFRGRVSLGISQRSGAIAPDPRIVPIESDGSFELTDVAAGDYVLQTLGEPGAGTPREFGSEFVTVADRDPPPVMIRTSVGTTLEGRFLVEGMLEPPMRAYSLHASPTDLDRSPPGGRGPAGLAIQDDGRFALTGLFGPMRLTAPEAMPGWYLKSVMIGGVDVTDSSFDFGRAGTDVPEAEVVLSNAGASIAGSILDGPARRAIAATVVVFPVNRSNWFDGSRHIKRTSSGPNGAFDVIGLPPGEYFVAAVDSSTPLDLQATDTLDALVSRAERITVRDGQSRTVTLRVTRR